MSKATTNYGDIKGIIAGGDAAARAALAAAPSTPPEALYYMARDEDAAVRRAVAGNPSTPAQADAMLARDPDVSVRCALARKAVGDGLDTEARRNLWRMGFTILETLARDQVVRVRKVLSEAFCTPADAPRDIVVRLARDTAEEVAAPVLRASPVLTDDDVVEILGDDPPEWAQRAIAERPALPARAREVLAAKGSVPAVARMLGNKTAGIPDATKQAPMATHPSLSESVRQRLSRVVTGPLHAILKRRKDAGPEIEPRHGHVAPPPVRSAAPRSADAPPPATAAGRARAMHEAGKLGDGVLAVALENGEQDFLIEALALRAQLPAPRVRRMVRAMSARTIMALAWRAGLSARFGLDLQRDLARIPPPGLLYARDGVEFPLTVTEMKAQLALFE